MLPSSTETALAVLPDPEAGALALIGQAHDALAEVQTLEQAESIFAQTKVLEAATRAIDLNKETIANAQELCVRAERRIGQLLPPPEMGRPRKSTPAPGGLSEGSTPKLSRGKQKQATRARKLANVLAETFEQAVEETKAKALEGEGNMTSETVLRKATPSHRAEDERAKRKSARDKFNEHVAVAVREGRWLEKNAPVVAGVAVGNELDHWATLIDETVRRLQSALAELRGGENG